MQHFWRALLVSGVFGVGVAGTWVLPAYAATHAGVMVSAQTSRLHIAGMTCTNGSCATTVYLALHRLRGVQSVKVNEGTQVVSVRYLPSETNPARFLKAVSNAGYPGTIIARKGG